MAKNNTENLDGIKLLANLPQVTRDKLTKQCTWRRFAAHEQIIDRDSDSRDIYFVTKGRVRVVNFSLSGREVSFDDLDAGGFFGELSAVDGQPRSASVVALSDTVVAALSPNVFKQILKDNPDVSLAIVERLAEVIRQATDRIMDLSTLGAHNRVHAELLRLSRHGKHDDNKAVIDPAPIHADIASRVSTTRETVARVLGDLSRNGLVSREKSALIVHDVERLESLVEHFKHE
ncbi:MAG: Crp/Fnr family transcriptional regulator [Alphaproteobacteria bacterium]|nr:Crp/Fnr family transcriptional regulator [Alphaproteobacteria bacterium]